MTSVPPGRFCNHCGIELKAKEPEKAPGTFCTSCGSPVGPDAVFCGQCGTKRGD